MTDERVEARLRQLALRFLNGLPDDLARLRSARADDDPAEVLGGILHRIVGRAGTFGFPAVGALASQLETMVIEGRWTASAFDEGLTELEVLSARAIEAGS
jgi:HPt (histidine-containing phosphotransfer) domain-containing protein